MLVSKETGLPIEYYPPADGQDVMLVSRGKTGFNFVRGTGSGMWVDDGTPEAKKIDRQLAGRKKQEITVALASEAKMNADKPKIVREAYGAGRWFPDGKAALERMVSNFIDKAETGEIKGRIVGAIAPHAGYVYSGPIAGYVFNAIRKQAQAGNAPDTVVILGFSHRGGFPGVALMDGDAIATPLGETLLDKEAAEILMKGRDVISCNYTPHRGEHSAENEIPFAQVALPKAKLVVALMGDHSDKSIGQLVEGLTELAKSKKILVAASADMLHDPDYDLVTRTDKATLKIVEAMDDKKLLGEWGPDRQVFCGIAPVAVTMRFAAGQGCKQGTTLKYENSGDKHPEGRGQWVVGYGAVVFTAPAR